MAVVREYLDSDRVNFLIWRYLLEGNYRETAAKFQKEWHIKQPHLDFSFAPHVKGHALISLVQKGLIYHAYERQSAQSQLPQHATADDEWGVFGPLIADAPAPEQIHDAEGEDDIIIGHHPTAMADAEASRKRSLHQLIPDGSQTKRQRLSNACDTRPDATLAATAMEIDEDQHHHHDDSHAYPSPFVEGEQPPSPIAHTEGPEVATQVDKVEELLPETTFISLTDDSRPLTSEGESSPSPLDTSTSAPILLQCEWNPKDPSILAASGTDSLARVWSVTRTNPSELEPTQDHVSTNVLSLIGPDTPPNTAITAISWNSDGSVIAVATDYELQATISICSLDGTIMNTLEVPETPITKLCWNPSDTALLAISPHKSGALVAVYDAATGSSLSYLLSGHKISEAPLDASWTSDTEFLLTGSDMLVSLYCADTSIVQVRQFDTRPDDSFSQVLFDWRSKLAATSSDKGHLDLWDETGQRKSISAHQGAITTMAWQPLPANQTTADDERLIATGGEDCAILIWNARTPESKAKCFLTMDSPIVRLAFTPDGAFIAGATSSQVLIWKVGSTTMPRATWSRPPHPGWLSPKAGSESEYEDEHCLCWDASGKKLAYGSNSRLAVINFSR